MTALTGTEFDGVLAPGGNPVLLFSGPALPTGNTLTFIAADTSDAVLDSAVYITSLSGENPVPLPPTVWLLGSGMAGLISLGWRRTSCNSTARSD
jgi:hypothetical protein